ncbi:MAG: DUF4357 domain-containing protein [Chloroflexota bacterium]|nr:DUF4357 domain-containing protein [Chloroflexota bacterium]
MQYLEARLLELARRAKRADLENETIPSRPNLSEADTADAESFLEDMLLIYPLLGVTAFEVTTAEPPRNSPEAPLLHIRRGGTNAVGRDTPEGFLVLKDSTGRIQTVGSTHWYILTLRQKLLQDGVMIEVDGVLRLTQDYLFESPSTAAAALMGRNANGREEWRDEVGRTLKEIQAALLPPLTSTATGAGIEEQ